MRTIDTSTWTKEELEQGFAIRRRGSKGVFKISLEDGKITHLSRQKRNKESYKSQKKVKIDGFSHKVAPDYEERLAKYKEIQKEANKRYDKGEIDKKERNKIIDDAHNRYIKGKGTTKTTESKKETTIDEAVEKIKGIGKEEEYKPEKRAVPTEPKEHQKDQALYNNSTNDESEKQKYLSIPEKERVQAYVDGKNWKDLVKEKEFEKSIDEMYNRFHGKTDEQIANEIAKERGERLLTPEEQKQREIEFMKRLERKVKRAENDEKVKLKAKQQMDQLHKMQEESGEWKNEGWGIYTRKTEKGTNYISSGRKANGSVDYVRTDYDKEGNELSSKTYKSLEKAQSVKQRATIQNDAKILKQLETNNKATEYGDGYSSVDLKDGYKISKYKDGQIQISKPHPYDETEYSWARKTTNGYDVIENGKVVKKTKTIKETINAIKERDENKKRTGGIW